MQFEKEVKKDTNESKSKIASPLKDEPEFKETINAIMTGTFYCSPGSGKPSFVEIGSMVKKGETICILEAMKLFNEIEAPYDCKILKILVKDGDLISKGLPLMAVEKN